MISSDNQHNIRHLLFCPGNKPHLFDKALNSQADLVVLDWEDSVSLLEKEDARAGFKQWCETHHDSIDRMAIRINSPASKEGLEDILFLSESKISPSFLVLPKVDSYGYVSIVNKLLSHQKVKFILLIESAEGVNSILQILERHYSIVVYVMIGNADLSSDLQCDNSREALLYTYSKIIAECRQFNIPVIDSPFFNLNDLNALKNETLYGKSIGCSAKAAIHPKQIQVINEVYMPTQKEIENAQGIIEASSSGVGVFDGRMVDTAMLKKAEQTLVLSKRRKING